MWQGQRRRCQWRAEQARQSRQEVLSSRSGSSSGRTAPGNSSLTWMSRVPAGGGCERRSCADQGCKAATAAVPAHRAVAPGRGRGCCRARIRVGWCGSSAKPAGAARQEACAAPDGGFLQGARRGPRSGGRSGQDLSGDEAADEPCQEQQGQRAAAEQADEASKRPAQDPEQHTIGPRLSRQPDRHAAGNRPFEATEQRGEAQPSRPAGPRAEDGQGGRPSSSRAPGRQPAAADRSGEAACPAGGGFQTEAARSD